MKKLFIFGLVFLLCFNFTFALKYNIDSETQLVGYGFQKPTFISENEEILLNINIFTN